MSQIKQCALYLRSPKLLISKLIRKLRSDGGLFRKPTYFEVDVHDVLLRLNIMPETERVEHLQGFKGYVMRQNNPAEAQLEALKYLGQVQHVLGVQLSEAVSVDSDAFRILMALASAMDGFIFVGDSILLPNGEFLIGPLAAEAPTPELVFYDELKREDYLHERGREGVSEAALERRERHYFELAQRGFIAARWLPIDESEPQLRPHGEIVQRVNALNALFHWVSVSGASTSLIHSFVEQNHLRDGLCADERMIFELPRERAQAEHLSTIGWRLENMWPLSWVLGFVHPPLFYLGQLPGEVVQAMVLQFLPSLDSRVEMPVDNMQSPERVAALEDLFYCAHNAVVSAQLGSETLPPHFHPVRDGGAIHERRHALKWCLSPGRAWDEISLDT